MSTSPHSMRYARMGFAVLMALLVLLLLDCRRGQNPLRKFARNTTFDPCNPALDYYEGDTHYFERDFVNDDGTMDYAKWFQSREVQSSDCDPLKKAKANEARAKGSPMPSTPVAPEKEQPSKSSDVH